MNYIGYTSAIAGEEVFEWVEENYSGDPEEDEVEYYDFSYFFGDYMGIYVPVADIGRQITAQYPTEEVITRCAVMQYFDDETNAAVNEMWEEIKGVPIPLWAYIVIAVIAGLVIAVVISYVYKGKRFEHKPKKGYRIIAK